MHRAIIYSGARCRAEQRAARRVIFANEIKPRQIGLTLDHCSSDLDRLFVIRDSAVKFTQGLESIAAAVVSGSMLRVEFDCLAVVHNRLVDLPLRAMNKSPTVVGIRISR